MDPARYLAGSIQAGDWLVRLKIQHLGLLIDLNSAVTVMEFRPEANHEKRRCDEKAFLCI